MNVTTIISKAFVQCVFIQKGVESFYFEINLN
jgi:hypothetical protein